MQRIGARQKISLFCRDALRISLLPIGASPALSNRPVYRIIPLPPLLVEVLYPLPYVRNTASQLLRYLSMRQKSLVYARWRGAAIS